MRSYAGWRIGRIDLIHTHHRLRGGGVDTRKTRSTAASRRWVVEPFQNGGAILRLSRYSRGVNPDFLRGHLEGLLLAVLVDDPGHGYALGQRLAARSGGELAVPEGSLYPALQRLERRGLVTSAWATVDSRRRRVYRLSAAGRRQAGAEASDWKVFSAALDRVWGGLT
jgi:PadR family transcriptional regulator PadR